MGLTGYLGLACDPQDTPRIIAMLNGQGDDDDDASSRIRYQPQFALTRENSPEVNAVLQALAQDMPQLAGLGTLIQGTDPVAEAGMGIQYLYTADTLRLMAEAYVQVSPEQLLAALEQVRTGSDPRFFASTPISISETFATVRGELTILSANGWALVGGMF